MKGFILNGFPPYTMPTRGIIPKWFPMIKLDGNWCDDILDIIIIIIIILLNNIRELSTFYTHSLHTNSPYSTDIVV